MLRPRSIAVLGASERKYSVGWYSIHNLLAGGFEGNIYPVNPGYDKVQGLNCYPDLAALPETVDHVMFALSDRHMDAALDEVIDHGARAATIMSQLIVENDSVPCLQQRVKKKNPGIRIARLWCQWHGVMKCTTSWDDFTKLKLHCTGVP